MTTQTVSPAPTTAPVAPAVPNSPPQIDESLREELDRIQTEEQVRIDRQRQEELARLREVARFD